MHRQKLGENPVIAIGLLVLAWLALATPAPSQELKVLPPQYQAEANRLVDKSPRNGGLKCSIEREKPYPDFTFHFDAGYYMTCPFRQFGGKDTRIGIFVQVTPRGRLPIVLGSYGIYRGSLAKYSPMATGKGKAEYDVTGGFSVGEGHYHVKVLLRDWHGRSCSRGWEIKVTPSEQKKVPVVLAAHQVAPVYVPAWHGAQSREGLRLAVLLSATSFSPYAARLRSWNQTMLLQILSALLQQTPCKSVRLVAFNLDRQRVIYRADSFEPLGFARLQRAFDHLNLAVVSVHALKRRNDWAEWLAGLANQQIAGDPPPDAVIFLGRTARWTHKVPKKLLNSHEAEKPRFFYFENGPWNQFPDALGYLTKSLGGKIYKINTPHDLGKAIQNMLSQLRQTGSNAESR